MSSSQVQDYHLLIHLQGQKIQSLMTFFQAELLNNYFQAFKIQNIASLSEEKLMNISKSFEIQFFSENLAYMIVAFKDSQSDLTINT